MNRVAISILASIMSAFGDKGSLNEKVGLRAIDGDYAVFHERAGVSKVSTLRISNPKKGFDTTFAIHGTFKKLHVDIKRDWVILIGDLKDEDNTDQFVVYNLKGDILFTRGMECEQFPPRYGCTESLSKITWYDIDSQIQVIEKGVTIRAPDRKHEVFINLKD